MIDEYGYRYTLDGSLALAMLGDAHPSNCPGCVNARDMLSDTPSSGIQSLKPGTYVTVLVEGVPTQSGTVVRLACEGDGMPSIIVRLENGAMFSTMWESELVR